MLESKRFYLDVKENQRGRFIKIAEISADGRKNQILMTFSTAAVFSQNLVAFIDFYKDLEKVDPDNLKQGELKSEVRIAVFVKLSMRSTVGCTFELSMWCWVKFPKKALIFNRRLVRFLFCKVSL